MPLYMPMQPSSKTPMMAFSVRICLARAAAKSRSGRPTATADSGRACGVGWDTVPPVSHRRRPALKASSVKSSLHRVEYRTPALVSDPFRFSMPTSPGHVPDQLATVRIGPRWARSPASRWWLYCQTDSATTSGASGSTPAAKTAMPCFWLLMNPCFCSASYGWARTRSYPSAATALVSAASISA